MLVQLSHAALVFWLCRVRKPVDAVATRQRILPHAISSQALEEGGQEVSGVYLLALHN
jgi:hypothetical protein